MTVKVALLQTNSPADQPTALMQVLPLLAQAQAHGADLIILPEAANIMESRSALKTQRICTESEDPFIKGLCDKARQMHIMILIGSAIIRLEGQDKYVNRALLIAQNGDIVARYDKIHLFDADTPDGRCYRESATIKPGTQAVVALTQFGGLGMSICYDVRFAALYRALAKMGAQMISVCAAFTVPTGKAHWEVLLRARAIETGCFILAAAQGGLHEDGLSTYGHSMIINPWGEIIASLDHDRPGILLAELDLSEVVRARAMLPQLLHDRDIEAL